MASTRRQEIARLLRQGRLSVLDIARRFGAPARSVLADLEHIRRGLAAGERWVVSEAECLSCGFVFKGRERLNTPSRCPRCRSEQIRDPEFAITAV
jgi:hypothetical protein